MCLEFMESQGNPLNQSTEGPQNGVRLSFWGSQFSVFLGALSWGVGGGGP